MAGSQASAGAFAATWRDSDDRVVATTWGGTMCWFPRKPWRLRIESDGFEHVIRCRECPGCLEFERRRLADRLHAKYNPQNVRARRLQESSCHNISAPKATCEKSLYLVRIYAPLGRHAEINHRLHRRPGLELEPGMYRLGTESFAVLARSRRSIPGALRQLGLEHRIESIRLSRGRRAWRAITAGVAVARVAYGEQVKRWYALGLPKAEGKAWEIVKMGKGTHYRRASSPRAWSRGNLVLVPPALWSMRRIDRRTLRASMAKASSPEAAAFVTSVVSALAQARSMQSPVIASSQPRVSREAMISQYRHVARVADVARVSAPSDFPTPSLPGEGGYTSSGHSPSPQPAVAPASGGADVVKVPDPGPAGPAPGGDRESEEAWKRKRIERQRRLLAEQLERLREKIMGGKRDEET